MSSPMENSAESLPEIAIAKPRSNEYHEFYETYVGLVTAESLNEMLAEQPTQLRNLLGQLDADEVNCLHEPYTWTLKQVMGHLIDCERVFSDRMLRIAVGDQTPIPGIDQQMFVRGIDYDRLSMADLLDEFEHLRSANQLAVRRLTPNDLVRFGVASDNPVTSRANLYMLVGHVEHHFRIMQKRLGITLAQ